jgi:ADP-heptose:LPS heptosyltransferase
MKYFNRKKMRPRLIKAIEKCILIARLGLRPFKKLLTRDKTACILVVDGFLIGDTVLLRPLMKALVGKYGQSHKILMLAGPHAQYILSDVASDIHIIEYWFPWATYDYSPRSLTRLFGSWLTFFTKNVDIAVETRGDFRSIAWTSLFCPHTLLGFDFTGGGRLLDTIIPDEGAVVHLFEHIKLIGQALRVTIKEQDILLAPHISHTSIFKIGISLVGSQPLRSFPYHKKLEIIDRLLEQDRAEIWYIVAPQDPAASIEALRQRFGEKIHFFHGSFAEYFHFMKTLDAYIGMDSGGGHLCSLFGIPAIILFGTQEPWYCRPVGSANLFCVETAEKLSCRPCDATTCTNPEYQRCLSRISVEEIIALVNHVVYQRTDKIRSV